MVQVWIEDADSVGHVIRIAPGRNPELQEINSDLEKQKGLLHDIQHQLGRAMGIEIRLVEDSM